MDPMDALEQAAEWFACLQGEEVSATERERWRQWLQASAAHRQAWARVERIDHQFRSLPAQPARQALQAAGRSRRRFLKGVVGLGLVAPVGWLAWRQMAPTAGLTRLHTATGEIREIELPDGSRLWLNTDTAVHLDYTPALRRLELLAGEVHLATAADPRPLRIDTPYGPASPLGTRFSVRLEEHRARVAVSAGRVAVTPRQGAGTSEIAAGRVRTFTRRQVSASTPLTSQDAAWPRGMLVADNLALGAFLAELERYRVGVIRCDAGVADLKLVGAYPLEDTDRVLAALEASLPVRVTRITPWWVSVQAR
ncbi:sensor [Thiohalobacter sp. COW1]|nr:sensor [Thiohalobacter sp. COW1]